MPREFGYDVYYIHMLRLFLNLGFVTTMERLRKVIFGLATTMEKLSKDILGGRVRCNNNVILTSRKPLFGLLGVNLCRFFGDFLNFLRSLKPDKLKSIYWFQCSITCNRIFIIF